MDALANGGMAPALQCSNHHTSGLADGGGNIVKKVALHGKINGESHKNFNCDDTALGTESSSSTSKAGCELGTSHTLNLGGFCDGGTSDCMLPNLKDLVPPALMPAVHFGQGDSTIANADSCNGWNECKRPNIGILQESNNISVVQSYKTMNKKTFEKIDGKVVTEKDCKTAGPVNGDHGLILPWSNNDAMGKLSLESIDSMTDKVLDSTSTAILNSIVGGGMASSQQKSCSDGRKSNSMSARCSRSSSPSKDTVFNSETVSDFVQPLETQEFASGSKILKGSMTSPSDNERATRCSLLVSVESSGILSSVSEYNDSPLSHANDACDEEAMLNYTDLLTRDLSKINMSDKLANTLQELAVSLQGSALLTLDGTKMPQNADIGRVDTVTYPHDSGHNPVKNLDISFNETLFDENRKEDYRKGQEARIKSKARSAIGSAEMLDCHLSLLKRHIGSLRCHSIKSNVEKQLKQIMPLVGVPILNTWTVEMNALGCTDTVDRFLDSKEFWRTVFSDTKYASNSNFVCSKLKAFVVPSEKDPTANECHVSNDVGNTDMLPYVHLTRFDKSGVVKPQKNFPRLAEISSGVLEKELKHVTSCFDSGLTDSSSEEESTEKSVLTSKLRRVPSKSESMLTVNRFRKSFCKWVVERAELSRRWTWLQSRISSLELSIRQQGELYSQLRNDKGGVQLDAFDNRCQSYVNQSGNLTTFQEKVTGPTSAAVSPCNVNLLVNNIHHQSSRLFSSLSPISGGCPSPNLPSGELRQIMSLLPESVLDENTDIASEVFDICSRTRPLQSSIFRNRSLVKIAPNNLALNEPLKPAAVPNDSLIMYDERNNTHTRKFEDHLVLKAALHDHSYHSVISSIIDIPLSVSIRAIMKSRRKWCRKSSPQKPYKIFRKHKNKKKIKHKVPRNNKMMHSAMVSYNELDASGKKLAGHVYDSSRKRIRGSSFDSDVDVPVVLGRYNSQQPTSIGTTTPTSEVSGQNPNFWKKKKSSEQAYDINNIIIPHGLNSARIEKLAYKEIQTPSWKVMELSPIKVPNNPTSKTPEWDFEDTSYLAFRNRHDNNEIIEKKKYTAFVEWSKARKGRGSRMGNIYGGSTTTEPVSLSSMTCTSSPLSFFGESISNYNLQRAPSTSYTAKLGVTTRRMSIDYNCGRPGALPWQQTQHNTDTSLAHSYSSPILPDWQDGLCSRRGSSETIINRSLSDSINVPKVDQALSRTWDVRTFPLNEEDLRLLTDVKYAKAKLHNDDICLETYEGMTRHSLVYQSSNEKAPAEDTRTASHDGVGNQKSGCAKRKRTDSTRASLLASHEDTARHSDASNTSISSNQSKRRRSALYYDRVLQKKGVIGSEMAPIGSKESVRKSKHKYLHVRLSETEDSLTDTADSDSSCSLDEQTSSSCDDAGHIVDDFADPEWEAPSRRDSR